MTPQDPSMLPSSTNSTSRSRRAFWADATISPCSSARLSLSLKTGITTDSTSPSPLHPIHPPERQPVQGPGHEQRRGGPDQAQGQDGQDHDGAGLAGVQ